MTRSKNQGERHIKKFVVKFLWSQTLTCEVDAENVKEAIQLADAQADRTGFVLQTYVRKFDVGTPRASDPRLLRPDPEDKGACDMLLPEEAD